MDNSTNVSAYPLRIRALQKTRHKKQNILKDSRKKKRMSGIPLREDQLMSKEIYEAASKGKVEILEETVTDDQYLLRKTVSDGDLLWKTVRDKKKNLLRKTVSDKNLLKKTMSDEDLLRKTFELNNILHVTFRSRPYDDDYDSDDDENDNWFRQKREFVREAVSRFPHLQWEKNLDGDTPLHLAVESRGNEDFVKEVCEKLTDVGKLRMKNSMGNTPLHVALIRNQPKAALIILKKDPSLATILNNSLEAPLHLAMKYFPDFIDQDDYDGFDPVRMMKFMEQKKSDFIGTIRKKETCWNYEPEEEDEKKEYYVSEEQVEIKIIMMLLEKASYVAGWQDVSGMTPLHLAASLQKAYNLPMISYIIHCCPQSMEVSDRSGKTILHHLIHRVLYVTEARHCLYNPRLYSLSNRQDHDGNTPAHLAIIKNDFIMFQLLLPSISEQKIFYLKNKAGQSVRTLYEQKELQKVLREGSLNVLMMTEEMCRRAECGDLLMLERLLDKIGHHYYAAHNSDGKNVIHILFQIKDRHVVIPQAYKRFIKHLVRDHLPCTFSDTDKKGDTPLHVLAQLNPSNIMIHLATGPVPYGPVPETPYPDHKPDDPMFLSSLYKKYIYEWKSLGSTSTFFTELMEICHREKPSHFNQGCSTQNLKGNTPLHEAIIAENFVVFSKLAEINEEATKLVNKHGDTVLHLLATINPTSEIIGDDLLRDIVKKHIENKQELLDKDGLTPLMRAIKVGNIVFAERMCSLCPKIAELKGSIGQTFWHLLAISPPIEIDVEKSSFFTEKVVWNQLETKDKNGDTALHIAINHHNFFAAKLFLNSRKYYENQKFHEHLLGIPTKDGKTPSELIGALPHLPKDFEEFIWEDSTMIGTRSMWKIPTTQMKDYVSTMGVIAALLTTITFTAAFTVPGGLNQEKNITKEKGTPLLISDVAFQVFMISNVLAMCLSMLVLFCLLWIMATGNKSKSVVLLDFSIMLLLAAFFLTLLTFMTGLYATTHLVKRWVAILSLVLCSLFLLVMLIYLVGSLVIPSRKAILIYGVKSYHYSKGLCKNSISLIQKGCCPWSNSPRREAPSSIPSNRSEVETSALLVRIEHP